MCTSSSCVANALTLHSDNRYLMSGFAANLHLTSGGVYLYSAISLRRKPTNPPQARGGNHTLSADFACFFLHTPSHAFLATSRLCGIGRHGPLPTAPAVAYVACISYIPQTLTWASNFLYYEFCSPGRRPPRVWTGEIGRHGGFNFL